MGREASELFEVRTLEDTRWSFYVDGTQGSTGQGQYFFDYTLAPEGGGTRLTVHARIEMGGGWFTKLMMKLFGGSFRKAIRKDHEALKAYIEKP